MNRLYDFTKENLAVGLFLFALFLGAGNIIGPPFLGQQAGENIVPALIGFLITGVGLPLLAIIAAARAGGDLYTLASRVHPWYGLIFTSIIYLTIGPLFATPRVATVAYEIGVIPFLEYLPAEVVEGRWPLLITSIIFFSLVLYLALNPSKMVDRIGKVLTPILLVTILILFIKSLLTPIGELQPAQGNYISNALTEGFIEGYVTIDVLSALVFAIVILQILKERKIFDQRKQIVTMSFAAVVAAVGLAFVYIALGYIGATSVSEIGYAANGGEVIRQATAILFGDFGKILLAITIILACFTTAVGLIVANAQFFNRIFPKTSYKGLIILFTLVSAVFANFGLTKLLETTLPVLLFMYPLAIVLMFISFIDHYFNEARIVYICTLIPTAFVALHDALYAPDQPLGMYTDIVANLPLFDHKLAWILPAVIGFAIGLILYKALPKKREYA
ncbi:branched-chain amino acid transport system carrier protein [Lysinibacillus alkalisoli]|uniref:Branched-chain amino acid transport system carrier protein n=1 Tax=Lysinibacillus alkalisoli TaxID=1911548 RepID=A0A917LFZ1_9BACI|nr:branched-chain amino acid transport system II carrier protein [Lysinibacillus alkalisoli]GGG19142.1 branched-chain amino acid transport system carrier protein [Lysinibacillus alkalisoli]